ncbi:MAG: thioesterase family protein [Bacillota bacterium]
MKDIPIGAEGIASVKVTEETLATRAGSGAVDVFSTPNLVLLMEEAAMAALQPYMEEGETSVGTLVNIRHLAATPPGFTVTAVARLVQVDGRRLVFQVEASDGMDKVGDGTHERFLVFQDRFNLRTQEKSTRRTISGVE